VSLDDSNKLLKHIADRVSNKSKSNIFLVCINVVRLGCQLIQILQRLDYRYPVLGDQVQETRKKIISIVVAYMKDVKTIEEMRFLLLSQDLDYRDALTYI
jgi:hypothetical protein